MAPCGPALCERIAGLGQSGYVYVGQRLMAFTRGVLEVLALSTVTWNCPTRTLPREPRAAGGKDRILEFSLVSSVINDSKEVSFSRLTY